MARQFLGLGNWLAAVTLLLASQQSAHGQAAAALDEAQLRAQAAILRAVESGLSRGYSELPLIRGQDAIPAGFSEAQLRAEAAILRALNTRFSGRFSETPLTEVLDAMGRAGNIQVRIDAGSLEDAGAGVDTPITKVFDSISLRSALAIILRPMDLAWIIVNESLVITTKEQADAEMRTVVYPVRDLVAVRRNNERYADFDSLIDLITTTLAPTTWDEVGGPGSIAEHRMTSSLVVSQTRVAHEQIQALLAALRRSGEIQGIVPAFPRPPSVTTAVSPATSAVERRQDEVFERRRFEVSAEAAWQVPRKHEFSR